MTARKIQNTTHEVVKHRPRVKLDKKRIQDTQHSWMMCVLDRATIEHNYNRRASIGSHCYQPKFAHINDV